jgi:futalosine hydrolase
MLVAATPGETAWLRQHCRLEADHHQVYHGRRGGYRLSLIHTGVGMVNTALHLGREMVHLRPDRVVHLGIAGSYDRSLPLATVVEVVQDSFSELGAESPTGFLDMKALGFPLFRLGEEAVYNTLRNPSPSRLGLPQVNGITVNKVHGLAETIAATVARWQPTIETMEGAAFFQVMLETGLSFASFRSLSNYVEPRNRQNWQVAEAALAVQQQLANALDQDLL